MATKIQERITYLEQVKKEKEEALRLAPEGTLRVHKREDRVEYYRCIAAGKRTGNYLRKKEIEMAKKLAQKDYDKKVLCAAEQELKFLYRLAVESPSVCVEDVYEHLTVERQKLVEPIKEPDALFVANWENAVYSKEEIDKPGNGFRTNKGEVVRSKSEFIIANMLYSEGIPYRYEYPIKLRGLGTVHPDFFVLNTRTRKEYVWEHLGMMDDKEYVERSIRKIRYYEKNGFCPGDNLLLTYETKNVPLDVDEVKWMVERYFK